jgi:hypothetical protein
MGFCCNLFAVKGLTWKQRSVLREKFGAMAHDKEIFYEKVYSIKKAEALPKIKDAKKWDETAAEIEIEIKKLQDLDNKNENVISKHLKLNKKISEIFRQQEKLRKKFERKAKRTIEYEYKRYKIGINLMNTKIEVFKAKLAPAEKIRKKIMNIRRKIWNIEPDQLAEVKKNPEYNKANDELKKQLAAIEKKGKELDKQKPDKETDKKLRAFMDEYIKNIRLLMEMFQEAYDEKVEDIGPMIVLFPKFAVKKEVLFFYQVLRPAEELPKIKNKYKWNQMVEKTEKAVKAIQEIDKTLDGRLGKGFKLLKQRLKIEKQRKKLIEKIRTQLAEKDPIFKANEEKIQKIKNEMADFGKQLKPFKPLENKLRSLERKRWEIEKKQRGIVSNDPEFKKLNDPLEKAVNETMEANRQPARKYWKLNFYVKKEQYDKLVGELRKMFYEAYKDEIEEAVKKRKWPVVTPG